MKDCPHFRISTFRLTAVAGLVWIIAGGNVAWIGLSSYPHSGLSAPWACVLPLAVFIAFGAMFLKTAGKNVRRIVGFAHPARPFWHFFDARSYLMMGIMMSSGILLRVFNVLPEAFVAFFYTGLGAALFCAGLFFLCRFARSPRGGR